MYEYECQNCGKKYYSSAEFSQMYEKERFCDECGYVIFYSVEELKNWFDNEEWLKKEYSELEKTINKYFKR